MRPTVIHIHVPKSAGTSINALLGGAIKGKHFAHSLPGKSDEFAAMGQSERDRIDFLFGHFPYGLHKFFRRPVHYVASVREPRQRLLSFYHFVVSRQDHPLHGLVKQSTKDFSSFVRLALDNRTVRSEVDNVQVRMLSGQMELRSDYSSALAIALFNVSAEDFSLVDIAKLPRLLTELSQKLGLTFDAIPRLNASNSAIDFDAELATIDTEAAQAVEHFGKWDALLLQAVTTGAALNGPTGKSNENMDKDRGPMQTMAARMDDADMVAELVRSLYRVLLLREPDQDGFSSRVRQLRGGRPIEDVILQILKSSEFADKHRRFLDAYVKVPG